MGASRTRKVLAIGVLGVALFATIGESSTDKTSSNNAPNAASGGSGEKTSESSGPASSKASPIPLGTSKTVAKGWDVKVNSANLDADAIVSGGNQFLQPDEGKKFVLVNVSITNNSGTPGSPFTNVKLSLLPPSGITVSSSGGCIMGEVPDKIDEMAQMQPSVTATGNLCFEPKADEVDTSLLLAEPQFTLDENKDQVFFAIK